MHTVGETNPGRNATDMAKPGDGPRSHHFGQRECDLMKRHLRTAQGTYLDGDIPASLSLLPRLPRFFSDWYEARD